MCFAPQRRALFRHFFDIWTSKTGPRPSVFNTFDFKMCFAPQRRALFRHLNFKSGPKLRYFVHFDLEMYFAPRRRALFRHLDFQKWSDAEVFCTFWLGNVLRATTACTFSASQLPKVVRHWAVLCILTWKCASRHNGVQFFISHLASWLRTRRFSEPTFRHRKSRLSYLFAHLHLLSSDLFSSDSFHLCFSTVHTVGSFTSKLPSIINIYIYIYIIVAKSNLQFSLSISQSLENNLGINDAEKYDGQACPTIVFSHLAFDTNSPTN